MNRILCIKPTRLKRGNVLDDNNGSYRPVIGVIGGEAEFHSSVSGIPIKLIGMIGIPYPVETN